MFDFNRWQSVNETYLSSSLDWLRDRLQRAIDHDGNLESSQVDFPTATDAEYQPALEVLASRFQLSDFEKQVLLLCAAMEFDTRVPALCATVHGSATRAFPTISLCFSLFADGAWDVLSPERPLRASMMVEFDRQPLLPLTSCPLRVDDRIAGFIKGLNYLDERLSPFVSPVPWRDDSALSDSQALQVDDAFERIDDASKVGDPLPVIEFLGPHDLEKRSIAAVLGDRLGIRLYQLPADLIPQPVDELDRFTRLWGRECRLVPMGLVIMIGDSDTEVTRATARRLVHRLDGFVVVDSLDSFVERNIPHHRVDVAKPTPGEQRNAWRDCLPAGDIDHVERLVGQFDLGLDTISEIASEIDDQPGDDAMSVEECLWDGCRHRMRPKLESLAQRIDVKASWDDIVLTDDATSLLRQINDQVRYRGKVLDEWGFRDKLNRGLGVTALFAGESGTGKTMAAEVIASDLRLDLYRIDLSSVVNKYIGETEKNLRRLFDAAEGGGAILFFDEADALFGRRSEVKDSHDRYANIEVNYLLQRLESYRGLAILATNHKQSLDPAFTRRLRFIIDFPFPEAVERKQIWRTVFPDATPLSGLNYGHLAKLRLTGGNIHNIALNAAYAAAEQTAVDMPTILAATKSELIKGQRALNASDLHWAAEEVA